MTKEEADYIGAMNMCDEISNEAYTKIMCHCDVQGECGDCISRETMLTKLKNISTESWKMKLKCSAETVWNQCIDYVKDAPSVEPERKTGKWIKAQFPFGQCSICGAVFDTSNNVANYCCVCGAKMEVNT